MHPGAFAEGGGCRAEGVEGPLVLKCVASALKAHHFGKCIPIDRHNCCMFGMGGTPPTIRSLQMKDLV